ncbi:MAG: DUF4157 domain-containing protein [Bacteroidales bacterium]|nr:DUF4157 domain-containing protein [Bacteroidales bacterium]
MFAKDEERKTQQKSEDEEIQKKSSPSGESEKKGSVGTKTTMPDGVRSKMENSFGTDFSGVNIHQNSEQASNMGALAYTQGNDIAFAEGQYQPESSKGQELLGHELTHVVQQRQGRVKPTKQGKGLPVNDNPSLEKEADEMGAKAAQGKMANVAGKGSGVQRKSEGQELAIDIKPYDVNNHDPFPEGVNKQGLISKARLNVNNIDTLRTLLISECKTAIENVIHYNKLKETDAFQLFAQKLFGLTLGKLASLNKYTDIGLEVLKAGFESGKTVNSQKGANKLELTFIDIRNKLDEYNGNIGFEVIDIRNNLDKSYSLTNYFANLVIEAKTAKKDVKLASDQFEIGIWKEVLPQTWKHMTPLSPSFHTSLGNISNMESKKKNIYYTYKSGSKGLIFSMEGYYITEHWLGSGNNIYTHEKAPEELMNHLITDLKVPRKEIFESWGIPHQTFIVNDQPMMMR